MSKKTLITVAAVYGLGALATYYWAKSAKPASNATELLSAAALWPVYWLSNAFGGLPRAQLPEV